MATDELKKELLAHFPDLSPIQLEQFGQLAALYEEWNNKINVISRKDMDSFNTRHLLHSLGIAKFHQFPARSTVLDIGTGGGFPGIPLAILFPETQFYLVDSIGKKIKVVNAVARSLNLKNVIGIHQRAEQFNKPINYIVSRAVTRMNGFMKWLKPLKIEGFHNQQPKLLYLKGGDLEEELKEASQGTKRKFKCHALNEIFEDAFFETKQVVELIL